MPCADVTLVSSSKNCVICYELMPPTVSTCLLILQPHGLSFVKIKLFPNTRTVLYLLAYFSWKAYFTHENGKMCS